MEQGQLFGFIKSALEGLATNWMLGKASSIVKDIWQSILPPETPWDEYLTSLKDAGITIQELLDNAQVNLNGIDEKMNNFQKSKEILQSFDRQESLKGYDKYWENMIKYDKNTGMLSAGNEKLEQMFTNAESLVKQNILMKAQEASFGALVLAAEKYIAVNKDLADAQEHFNTVAGGKSREEVDREVLLGLAIEDEVDARRALLDLEAEQESAREQFVEAQMQIMKEGEALDLLAGKYSNAGEDALLSNDSIKGTGEIVGESQRRKRTRKLIIPIFILRRRNICLIGRL